MSRAARRLRSLVAYPGDFTFHVARPGRSVVSRSLPLGSTAKHSSQVVIPTLGHVAHPICSIAECGGWKRPYFLDVHLRCQLVWEDASRDRAEHPTESGMVMPSVLII